MKLSTLVELAGFAALAFAAWLLNPVAGVAVAGVFLLLVGYSIEDEQVAVSVRRIVAPVTARRARRRARKSEG